MQPSPQHNARAAQSRINGAKSRSPKTPRAPHQASPHQAELFSVEPNLLATLDPALYAALRQAYQAAWQPANPYVASKVDDLAAYRWELDRLRAVRRQIGTRIFNEVSSSFSSDFSIVCDMELRASTDPNTILLNARIRHCNLETSRIEHDIVRVQRYFSNHEVTQNSLQTNETEPEITQAEPTLWAEASFGLNLDPHQAAILASTAKETILTAARYSGKTTALALRALHASIHQPEAEIACLSPNDELKNKIAETAAILGHNTQNISDTLTNTATLVIVDDAADLPNDAFNDINPEATVILAATPHGASGYFFARWRNDETAKITARVNNCDLIDDDLRRLALSKLSESAWLQEFDCEFLNVTHPRCRLVPLTQ